MNNNTSDSNNSNKENKNSKNTNNAYDNDHHSWMGKSIVQ